LLYPNRFSKPVRYTVKRFLEAKLQAFSARQFPLEPLAFLLPVSRRKSSNKGTIGAMGETI